MTPNSPESTHTRISRPRAGSDHRPADRRTGVGLAALLWLALWAGPAGAIDASLCRDDGVTEVPGFAIGRDSNQCLMVDPGNGDAPVPFQYEKFNLTGIGVGCGKPQNAGVTRIEHNMDTYGRCPTQGAGELCSQVFWNVTFDNYLDPACKNEDILFFAGGTALQYLLFKNSKVINSWKCAGGGGWDGPNGIGCGPGEDSASHTDGIQMRSLPTGNGWVVFQDSVFANGYNYHFLNQGTSSKYGKGSMLFQGVHFGRIQSVGAAKTYIDDCHARRPSDAGSRDICDVGRTLIDTSMNEVWFVDVFGTSTFNLKGAYDKVVVVNTGCDDKGCNGTIGYREGWPHPLNGAGSGPSICPNGAIPSNGGGPAAKAAYCYTSLENALNDGHKAPPFVHLSAAGWENPPEGATPTRPFPPVLLQ